MHDILRLVLALKKVPTEMGLRTSSIRPVDIYLYIMSPEARFASKNIGAACLRILFSHWGWLKFTFTPKNLLP